MDRAISAVVRPAENGFVALENFHPSAFGFAPTLALEKGAYSSASFLESPLKFPTNGDSAPDAYVSLSATCLPRRGPSTFFWSTRDLNMRSSLVLIPHISII